MKTCFYSLMFFLKWNAAHERFWLLNCGGVIGNQLLSYCKYVQFNVQDTFISWEIFLESWSAWAHSLGILFPLLLIQLIGQLLNFCYICSCKILIMCPTVAFKVFMSFLVYLSIFLYCQGHNKLHKNDSLEIELNIVNYKGENQEPSDI